MKKFVFILASLSVITSNAQTYTTEPTTFFGGALYYAKKVVPLNDDSKFIVAEFKGTIDVDPGSGNTPLSSTGTFENLLLQKVDANNNLIFYKNWGSTSGNMDFSHIELDSMGNCYLFGNESGTFDADLGAGTTTILENNTYIIKLNAVGDFMWAKQLIGTIHVNDARINSSGIYLGGSFYNDVNFDPLGIVPNVSVVEHLDAFAAKYSLTGDLLWINTLKGYGFQMVNSLDIDPSGNVMFGGTFSDTIDFNPSPVDAISSVNSYTDRNAFLWQLNSNGQYLFHTAIGSGLYTSQVLVLNYTQDGSLLVSGNYADSTYLDIQGTLQLLTPSVTGLAVFAMKISPSFEFDWVHTFTGSSIINLPYVYSINSYLGQNTILTLHMYGEVFMDGNTIVPSIDPEKTFLATYILDAAGDLVCFGDINLVDNTSNANIFESWTDQSGFVNDFGNFYGNILLHPGNDTLITNDIDNDKYFIRKWHCGFAGAEITENGMQNDFILYPNPLTGNILSIKGTTEWKSLDIFNSLGQKISTEINSENTIQLELNRGIYFLKILTDNGIIVKQLVVE